MFCCGDQVIAGQAAASAACSRPVRLQRHPCQLRIYAQQGQPARTTTQGDTQPRAVPTVDRRELVLAAVGGFSGLLAVRRAGAEELASEQELQPSPPEPTTPSPPEPTTPAPLAITAESCVQDNCLPFKALRDGTLAYEFVYPVQTSSGRPLSMLLVRRPERYSSAAPLTADARQRIVAEVADFKAAVTVSVSVGPPSGALKDSPPEKWKGKDVANTVLIDRSTARVTTGQRVSLSSIEALETDVRDGTPYYVYEHVSQGAPRLNNTSFETYRHSYAVSAVRAGANGTPYIYTLNMSCPDELWGELGAYFKTAAQSFRLMPPSKEYVAPDQEPWRFF